MQEWHSWFVQVREASLHARLVENKSWPPCCLWTNCCTRLLASRTEAAAERERENEWMAHSRCWPDFNLLHPVNKAAGCAVGVTDEQQPDFKKKMCDCNLWQLKKTKIHSETFLDCLCKNKKSWYHLWRRFKSNHSSFSGSIQTLFYTLECFIISYRWQKDMNPKVNVE